MRKLSDKAVTEVKLLRRNRTEFKYYAYTGLNTDVDENGLHTGVWQPVYSDPATYSGNISTPSGSAVQAFDGLEIRYSHVLVMDDPNVDIRETGYVEWRNHKYDVTAVRPSMNVLSVALLQRVEDNGDQYIDPVEPVTPNEHDNPGDPDDLVDPGETEEPEGETDGQI